MPSRDHPYSLDLYDADGRWLAGWSALTVPLDDALALVRAVFQLAVTYRRNRGEARRVVEEVADAK